MQKRHLPFDPLEPLPRQWQTCLDNRLKIVSRPHPTRINLRVNLERRALGNPVNVRLTRTPCGDPRARFLAGFGRCYG